MTTVSLDSQVQCGDSATRQCWDTHSSTLSQAVEPVSCLSGVYLARAAPWSEMANHGGYSGSNVMLVRNESSTDMSLVTMLASCAPAALQVQRAGGGLEEALASCGQKRFFSPTFETSGEDPGEEDNGDDCTQHVEKKRRLSFDQVRSLEKSFEVDNKLEPERKMQLARDLGLLPRQVAVWFQNRRARWKTKQLERDFEALTAEYNLLKSEYDAVFDENLNLQIEIDSLTGKLQTKETSPDVELPEPNKKSTTSSSPKDEATEPGPAPAELKCNASNNDESNARKEEGSGEGSTRETVSSDSISSELLNEDSQQKINIYPQVSPEMDSSILHLSDNLCDQILSPLDCQSISVKPEDRSFQDDSCNYILSQLEDEKGLPWWDWP